MLAVVIPIFNAHEWIEETLQSVLKQDFDLKEVELILVDDLSTDNSIALAEKTLKNSGVRYRVLKGTGGWASRARNLGWRATTAEWIQFIDADDLLHPRKLSIQTSFLRERKSDAAVLYSKWKRLTLEGGRWQLSGDIEVPRLEEESDRNILEAENFLQLGAALFRRSWLEKVGGFDDNLRPVEDVNLLLRIACAGGVFQYVESEEPLLFYRQVSRSFSRRNDLEFVECCLANTAWAEAHWRNAQKLDASRTMTLVRAYSFGARYFAGKDWKRFRELDEKIHSLTPAFLPEGPPALRLMTRLIGYRRAEHVAVFFRALRRRV